ncbi:hypothetical protein [Streptomyces radicis]|uniref:Uncharacterized protein n=1 Tax=Streptomyces radicis TaxID=1750517 RepID=A0A3A9W881_9ACTN|nr:hypothetical protein [Streptomyces radicis]RKN09070.1 hypothetical protein D7319_14175 [Streptomyces radicis]RKN22739.1 hypothetical protein D7318_14380 [Streptomyces radicis]
MATKLILDSEEVETLDDLDLDISWMPEQTPAVLRTSYGCSGIPTTTYGCTSLQLTRGTCNPPCC